MTNLISARGPAEINRWSPFAIDGGCDAYAEMEPDEVGDYVNYEDHIAAIDDQAAKIKALVDALKEAKQELEEVTEEFMGEDYNSPSLNAAIAAAKEPT